MANLLYISIKNISNTTSDYKFACTRRTNFVNKNMTWYKEENKCNGQAMREIISGILTSYNFLAFFRFFSQILTLNITSDNTYIRYKKR